MTPGHHHHHAERHPAYDPFWVPYTAGEAHRCCWLYVRWHQYWSKRVFGDVKCPLGLGCGLCALCNLVPLHTKRDPGNDSFQVPYTADKARGCCLQLVSCNVSASGVPWAIWFTAAPKVTWAMAHFKCLTQQVRQRCMARCDMGHIYIMYVLCLGAAPSR